MTATATKTLEKFRKDYQVTDFAIDSVELAFELEDDYTMVSADIHMHRTGATTASLCLDGEELETISVALNGVELSAEQWRVEDETLVIDEVPDSFTLNTKVRIKPHQNTQLSGLYRTNGNYCTQCEAEGFRRITWFLDRPDVMTIFKVRIEAERNNFPVLLSNGNKVESGELPGNRHYAVWDDPFKKPSYLFALVAGDLGHVHATFTTMSGRNVDLYVYSEHVNADKLEFALGCLQSSMKWDEDKFGREYDLDIFNIVAVGDFNMGAMENKSLNVFNTAYILARPDTATDFDYERIDGVIAHEYFHNWTGNRVTCRDWFQLTLKEGLTVFRDQLYSADMSSAAVKRIEDVKVLRSFQFPEDGGPMAHPIRPESYIAMDNFYTSTVYSKGAEVIGMYRTMLGKDGFRKGMDLYFDRHDGQAVTCDDFRAAMADANGVDLDQFERWYLQAGTPVVNASSTWDADAGTFTLNLSQSCAATPGQEQKLPFQIPVRIGLLGADGSNLVEEQVLQLREESQNYVFSGLDQEPTPSLLRGFSAPVRLNYDWSNQQLALLMASDSDDFNRWEAGQTLFTRVVLELVEVIRAGGEPGLDQFVVDAFSRTLTASGGDRSLQAYALSLPDEATLSLAMKMVFPDELHRARRFVIKELAAKLKQEFIDLYQELSPRGSFEHNPAESGRRRLRNLCLGYLSSLEDQEAIGRCQQQMESADNMTDEFAALSCLAGIPGEDGDQALEGFYGKWKQDDLVVDKWLGVQAGACRSDTCERVEAIRQHEAFDIANPNKARALIRVFLRNLSSFHRADGAGYRWVADRVLELDKLNPQIAARMAGAFSSWRRFDQDRQELMKVELERILAADKLSKDLFEIASKTINS